MITNRNGTGGFTLVETMVAIAILAIALIGPFIAIRTSLNASYTARDQLIATSLAQEGMEYIRSVRDNNYLNGRDWLDGLTSYTRCYGASSTGYCRVDPSQGDIHTDDPNDSAMYHHTSFANVPVLNLSATGIYNQQATSGTNPETRFRRGVRIVPLRVDSDDNPIEVRVTVMVQWVTAQQTYTTTVTDTLQDWI